MLLLEAVAQAQGRNRGGLQRKYGLYLADCGRVGNSLALTGSLAFTRMPPGVMRWARTLGLICLPQVSVKSRRDLHQSGLSSLVGNENQLARRSAESRWPLYRMHVTGSPRDSNVYVVVSPFSVSA